MDHNVVPQRRHCTSHAYELAHMSNGFEKGPKGKKIPTDQSHSSSGPTGGNGKGQAIGKRRILPSQGGINNGQKVVVKQILFHYNTKT